MFEPVTITCTVVTAGWLAGCGVGVISCDNAGRTEQETPVMIARHIAVFACFFKAADSWCGISGKVRQSGSQLFQWLTSMRFTAAMFRSCRLHLEEARASSLLKRVLTG